MSSMPANAIDYYSDYLSKTFSENHFKDDGPHILKLNE